MLKVHGNRKYDRDSLYFNKINTKSKAYTLGYWATDGNVHSSKPTISLKLQESDRYILEDIARDMQYAGPIYHKKRQTVSSQNQSVLEISDPQMHSDLCSLGIVPNKTWKLYMPPIPEEFFGDFLRGVIDGDGHVGISYNDKEKNYLSVDLTITGFRDFLEDLKKELERRFPGIRIYIAVKTKREKDPRLATLRVRNRSDMEKLFWLVYHDTDKLPALFLRRKYEKWVKLIEYKKSNTHIYDEEWNVDYKQFYI